MTLAAFESATTLPNGLAPLPHEKNKVQPAKSRKKGLLLRWTGFNNTLNLTLSFLTVGLFSFFSALHLLLVQPDGRFSTPLTDGEIFWFTEQGRGKWANQIHLWSVIPAGILLPFQFFPAVRRRYTFFHRYSGRILFTMLGIGSISGLRMSAYAFGGTYETKLYCILIATGSLYGIYKAVTSARRRQFDQHRVWALRTWAYACSILTLRIVLIVTVIFNMIHPFIHTTFPLTCAEIRHLNTYRHGTILKADSIEAMYQRHPACLNTTIPAIEIIVPVQTGSTYPEQETAMFNLIFGATGLIGLVFNVVAIETYLWWTKRESERLKRALKEGKVMRKVE